MKLEERINLITEMFGELGNTSSRNEKEQIVEEYTCMDSQLKEDISLCFSILTRRTNIGFTFTPCKSVYTDSNEYTAYVKRCYDSEMSLLEYFKPLIDIQDKSQKNLYTVGLLYGIKGGQFVRAIVNRLWKPGISNSYFDKNEITPMLAKKFEGGEEPIKNLASYYVTEKLDGNRCLAKYNSQLNKWQFWSRTNKVLNIQLNMGNFPKEWIYDGEVLSIDQVAHPGQENFNALSGVINSKYKDKSILVYRIFDVTNAPGSYASRRKLLDLLSQNKTENVEVLPVLKVYKNWEELVHNVSSILTSITSKGGEGVMINNGNCEYEHKRTWALMKLKEIQSMDMEVIDYQYGTGKYAEAIGSLECIACDKNGEKEFHCSVGSGLSDHERWYWAAHPEKILGKIVEVQYFSISQDKNTRDTNVYSLRFPRFKGIRYDKSDTSID